ncbi:hypothetical protein K9M48_02520 [Candidatus Gracilibacteria bacterium]|nr:hypothetical protein [Candidatus Gracilibacteria bacterium]
MPTQDDQNTKNQNDDLNLNFDFILDEEDEKKQNETKKEDDLLNFGIVEEKQEIKKEDKKEMIDNNPVVQEEIPVIQKETPILQEETPVVQKETPVIQEETPVVQKETPVVQEETPIVQEETPILQEEIPIVQEETPVIQEETPILQEETPVIQEETPVVQEETPIVQEDKSTKNYEPSMDTFNQTIEQLNNSREQGEQKISSDNLIQNTNNIDKEDTNTQTQGVINLDDVLGDDNQVQDNLQFQSTQQEIPQETETTNTVPENPIAQDNKNPYETITNPTNTDNPDAKKEHKKHLIKVIGITSVCVIAGFFILKTMYPMQFNSSDTQENPETTIETPVEENPFLQEPEPVVETPIDNTTNEETPVEETIPEEITTEEPLDTNTDTSNQDHNTTNDEIDPFQELDNIQTQEKIKEEESISTIQSYIARGKEYLEIGNETNNRDIIKYSKYISIKGESILKQLETADFLDIQGIDSYLAQSSGYLIQLENLKNEELSKPEITDETGDNNETQEETNGSGEDSSV